jgi:uncharacterized Zn finger protein (UPF0148 family)
MSCGCNKICLQYKAERLSHGGRYESGQKRCNSCGLYIFWDGLFCPCCGYRLRLSPRNSKHKQKFLKLKADKKEIIIHGV